MPDARVRGGFVRLTKLHDLEPETPTDTQWIDAAEVREIAPRTVEWADPKYAKWRTSFTDIGFRANHWLRVAEPAETVIDLVAEARQTLGPNWWDAPQSEAPVP